LLKGSLTNFFIKMQAVFRVIILVEKTMSPSYEGFLLSLIAENLSCHPNAKRMIFAKQGLSFRINNPSMNPSDPKILIMPDFYQIILAIGDMVSHASDNFCFLLLPSRMHRVDAYQTAQETISSKEGH